MWATVWAKYYHEQEQHPSWASHVKRSGLIIEIFQHFVINILCYRSSWFHEFSPLIWKNSFVVSKHLWCFANILWLNNICLNVFSFSGEWLYIHCLDYSLISISIKLTHILYPVAILAKYSLSSISYAQGTSRSWPVFEFCDHQRLTKLKGCFGIHFEQNLWKLNLSAMIPYRVVLKTCKNLSESSEIMDICSMVWSMFWMISLVTVESCSFLPHHANL